MKLKRIKILFVTALTIAVIAGCTSTQSGVSTSTAVNTETTTEATTTTSDAQSTQTDATATEVSSTTATTTSVERSALNTTELFSDKDYEQTANTSAAQYITVASGQDITINQEGVYVISGDATDVTIFVEAEDTAKVQIVLDGVSISNTDVPAIYVKAADKVFVTTTNSENSLEVTDTYTADGDTNLDAVIFSKADLVLNGTGTLTINSAEGNGITSKDDLKVTGGTYSITAAKNGLEANDFIGITDGTITIQAGTDAIHCENSDDTSVGSIYIGGGTINVNAGDDGIRATTVVQIDDGNIAVNGMEGIEGTYIQLNGGTIDVYASDDGINATNKSTSYDVLIEVNGGNISVEVGSGDTDAFDANGSIVINDGTIDVTANSGFDFDTTGELNGGTVTLNGAAMTEMTASMGGKGGGMHGSQTSVQ